MAAKRTTRPRRSEYIKINTDAETKERLQAIADERGWSLSLLCHEVLRAWLEESRYHGDIRWGDDNAREN